MSLLFRSESEPLPSPLTDKSLLFDDIPTSPALPGNQTDAEEEEGMHELNLPRHEKMRYNECA
ncbi:hypothetical protein DPMN_175645 [Dreissena polymorpha]|uniref:Uncharacterized protein n=1 Tax=Dreissena polymorpha TaxID=45954 RepID=A0A9D4E8K2_DREPO|nr:hypothetical protein DPMN_175645 [Dreissena polymorpha]